VHDAVAHHALERYCVHRGGADEVALKAASRRQRYANTCPPRVWQVGVRQERLERDEVRGRPF
jgi:hypothetical protein